MSDPDNIWFKVTRFISEFLEKDNEYQSSFFQFLQANFTEDDFEKLKETAVDLEDSYSVREVIDFVEKAITIITHHQEDSYNMIYDVETGSLVCVCLNPSLSLNSLLDLKARSIIITSGTMAPLKNLIKELGIQFGEVLQNSHVIKSSQILVQVVTRGSDGADLNSSFKNRQSAGYLTSLGASLVNYFRIIPGGVLVFFSSYSAMDSALSFWQDECSHWKSMKQVKSPPKLIIAKICSMLILLTISIFLVKAVLCRA